MFYDFEFHDNGLTIEPISLGMVREDGEKLYVINAEFDLDIFLRHTWLRENVAPHLPIRCAPGIRVNLDGTLTDGYEWDRKHPDWATSVWNLRAIRAKLEEFLLGEPDNPVQPELWGWYSAYDHVCLAQMWGSMVNLPRGIPMWTNDLRQVVHQLGNNPQLQEQVDEPHHALADAEWIYDGFYEVKAYVEAAMEAAIGATTAS